MRRLTLDLAVPVLLAATLVAFAAGSSSVTSLVHDGRGARWVALLALFVAAVAWVGRPAARFRVAVVAAAVAFAAIAVESSVWSVDPRLTIERAGTFVLLFATAGALALRCAARPESSRPVLWGIAGGAFAVTVLGLVTLAFDHSAAVQAATYDLPARYRGFGQNPDTASLLLALCLPIAVWLAYQARGRERIAALACGLAFDASIAASGSRGAIIAGFVGVFVVIAFARERLRARALAAGAAAVLLGVTIAVALAPTSKGNASKPATPAQTPAAVIKAKPGYANIGVEYPLEFDIGFQGPGESAPTHRTLFGLSGRGEAWRGTIDLADQRPALGYGFGTEDRVFIDRYANFVGGSPEDSYIGIYLELGAFGLIAFAALVLVLAFTALRRRTPVAVISLAVLVTALVIAVVQSYIYSVGDIGTVTVWVCAFLGTAAVGRRVGS
ncbi:MAG: O-antigen ligase family protein [Actinobacteria bacterium]|nr:O-antigen ligase family protein [Actinomycetota bacterium]